MADKPHGKLWHTAEYLGLVESDPAPQLTGRAWWTSHLLVGAIGFLVSYVLYDLLTGDPWPQVLPIFGGAYGAILWIEWRKKKRAERS